MNHNIFFIKNRTHTSEMVENIAYNEFWSIFSQLHIRKFADKKVCLLVVLLNWCIGLQIKRTKIIGQILFSDIKAFLAIRRSNVREKFGSKNNKTAVLVDEINDNAWQMVMVIWDWCPHTHLKTCL